MKNGVLRFIPLQADLCLNKQKVDIEDFKGWQKCNAPVYGDCLSPLYKKEDDHHDIFINNDYYDWSSGALSKNGTQVWTGGSSKKISKMKSNYKYDALAVTDTHETYINILSSNSFGYAIHSGTYNTKTLDGVVQIVTVKAFENTTYGISGIVVMYLHTTGKHGYYIKYRIGETEYEKQGSGESPTLWENFDVISPLIQVGVVGEGKFVISFFGSSGANLGGTDVKNVYVAGENVYDSPLFHDSTTSTVRYGTHTENQKITISVTTTSGVVYTSYGQSPFAIKAGCKQRVYIKLDPHPQTMTVELINDAFGVLDTFVFPASETVQEYTRIIAYYGDPEQNVVPTFNNAKYYYKVDITGTSLTPVSYEGTGTGIITTSNSDLSTSATQKIFPSMNQKNSKFYAKIKYNKLDNPNDTEQPTYTTQVEQVIDGDGLLFDNYCAWGTSSPVSAWSTYTDFNNFLDANMGNVNRGMSNGGFTFNPFWSSSFSLATSPMSSVTVYLMDVSFIQNKKGYFTSAVGEQYYNHIPDNTEYSLNNPYKTQYVENSLKEVDCVFDDGHLYCVGNLSSDKENPLPRKYLALSGTFASYDSATNTISYTADAMMDIAYDEGDDNIFPKYYEGMNISISNYYLRIVYLFKAKKNDTDLINIVVDNLSIANGDATPTHLLAGVQQGTNANLQGGVYNCPVGQSGEGFRLLFNNNMISNISCFEDKRYIGTILADWFTIDNEFCIAFNKTKLYYKDNNGDIWVLQLISTSPQWDYRLVEDRYIVFNTTKYFNCYDTKTSTQRHWASDYNNRIVYGYGFDNYTNNTTFKKLLETQRFRGLMITAQNANYEMTKDMITGLLLGAIIYEGVLKDYMTFYSCDVPFGAVESVDLYRGEDDSTSAMYVCSYRNAIKFINNDLVNPYAVYPISENGDIQFNPNLFTMFIKSYNNKDMVISDGIAYRLVYFNNVVPVMAYYMLDGVEELIGAFVFQTSYYGVSESRLYQMNYSNGVGVEVVADITNMEYLGALPSQALFWSAQNRAIYSFKGNCIMALMQYANELTGIYGKWYNPATQELFLDTNIGILVFSDLGTYCLEWEEETEGASVKDIFFFKDHFIVNLIDDTEYSYYYSYNNLEGYTSNGIYIFTKYYGNGLVPITVNNVYVRLYNQSVANAEGTISFKGHTITDIGTQTDEKTVAIGGEDNPTANPPTVAGEEWDSPTDTMLVKYTPQYNRGLGFALEIHTTFPIIDIKFDYVENGSIESQIAHINI